ncbi:MAG: ATP-binding protein [Cyclobacteriaceae bacterium]
MKQLRTPNNPFLLTGYHSPPYFCNREEELLWLKNGIQNERNMVLHAERRIGKSALIKHLFYHLNNEKKFETIYVDLLGTTDLNSANERIGHAVISKFGNLEQGIMPKIMKLAGSIGATFSLDEFSGLPQLTFVAGTRTKPSAQSLDVLASFLLTYKKPIIICLDEFQEIANYPEKEAEALFRSWTQNFPTITFIFSGSHQHLIKAMFNERSRPFFKSAQMRQLGAIPSDEYHMFIKGHFEKGKKSIDDEVIAETLKWTLGQTYYIQVILNKLYGSDQCDRQTLILLFDELIQQEAPIFSTYQRLLTSFQWKLLKALATEEIVTNPLSKRFINRHSLGAASSVSTGLKKLINTQMIVHDNGYRVQDVLLLRYLQSISS